LLHVPGLTEGNHEKLHFDSRTADRDLNLGTVAYDVEVLPVETAALGVPVQYCDARVMYV